MSDLTQKQAAVLQETLLLVGLHSDDYLFLTQTEASLWMTYETTIRQKKGAEAEKIINQIKNNPDLLDRVVSLIDVIRTLDLDATGNMAMDNLQENVRILQEKRDKERLAREAEAIKKVGAESYQKHLDLLKRISQKIPTLEKSIPDIAPSLILEPIGTIEKLAGLIPPEILSPLIPEISDPIIENIYLQAVQIVPQPAAAAAVTVLKIATPQTTAPQIQQLLDRLILSSEAAGKPLNIPHTAAATLSKIQAPSPTAPPLTLSLHNQFLKAGYPTPQASTLASQFASQFVPLINTIASFTPHQPTDSPQQHSQRVSQVKIYFSNQVIEYLSLRTVYFTRPTQFYSFQDNYSPSSHLTPNQSGWLNYLAGSAKNKVLGKAQDVVWERFAASEIGKKALTSLGTKAATTAATVGAEAAVVGAEIAAGPPGWVLAALTVLATFGKDVLSWAKRNFKKLAVAIGATIGLLIGGPVGAVFGAVGGFVVASPLVSLSATANAIGTGITSASTAMVGLVATEIATPIIIIGLSIPVAVALILFIINTSALVVPVNNSGISLPGPIPEDCRNNDGPIPAATDVRFSPNGKYAFPIAPFSNVYYGCSHWDGTRASDIGVIGDTAANPPSRNRLPIVAYTGGIISSVVMNDSLGGKYIILSGNDGRYYYYAHNCQIFVKKGDSVTVGQVIASSDNTGSAATTVEHLHFSLSRQPNFVGGGNLCPAADFKDKFGLTNCNGQLLCAPR